MFVYFSSSSLVSLNFWFSQFFISLCLNCDVVHNVFVDFIYLLYSADDEPVAFFLC